MARLEGRLFYYEAVRAQIGDQDQQISKELLIVKAVPMEPSNEYEITSPGKRDKQNGVDITAKVAVEPDNRKGYDTGLVVVKFDRALGSNMVQRIDHTRVSVMGEPISAADKRIDREFTYPDSSAHVLVSLRGTNTARTEVVLTEKGRSIELAEAVIERFIQK